MIGTKENLSMILLLSLSGLKCLNITRSRVLRLLKVAIIFFQLTVIVGTRKARLPI